MRSRICCSLSFEGFLNPLISLVSAFLVDTSELFSIIFCFTVLFPSSNSCDTNIANYAYVRRFICRIVYILSFFLFSLIDNSLHNYAEILSDFARICRKRRFLSHMFCWNSLKRDWKTEEIGGEDDYIPCQCVANVLWKRKNAPCFFSNAACSWWRFALLFKMCKPHFGKSKAHSDKCAWYRL